MTESLGISSQKPIMGKLVCGEMGTVELKKGSADPTTEDLKRVAEGARKVKGKESLGVGERMDIAEGIGETPKEDVKVSKDIERTALASKLGRKPTKQEVSARMGREQYSGVERGKDTGTADDKKRIIDSEEFQSKILQYPINVTRQEERAEPKPTASVKDYEAGAPRFLPGKARTTQEIKDRAMEQMDIEHDYIGINSSDINKFREVYDGIIDTIKSGDLPNLKSINSEFINALKYKDPGMVAAKLYNFMYTDEYKKMDKKLYKLTGKHIFNKKMKDMFFDQREEGRDAARKEYKDVEIYNAKNIANYQWDTFVEKLHTGKLYESMYDPKRGVTLKDKEKTDWIIRDFIGNLPIGREGKIVALNHVVDKDDFKETNKVFKNVFGTELLTKDEVQNIRDAYDEVAEGYENKIKETWYY